MGKLGAWFKRRWPKAHHALTRRDGAWPVTRDVLGIVLGVLLLGAMLWGLTGQKVGDRPVVVVESGSMMHCTNGVATPSLQCDASRYGRFGTIDPGDLIFVRDVDGRAEVTTLADGGRDRYGKPGDVIIFRQNGQVGATPIIHRALFWLEIGGTPDQPRFSIFELGLIDRTAQEIGSDPRVQAMVGQTGFWSNVAQDCRLPEQSGFVTRGDNNPGPDNGCPVQMSWIIGKSRGEVPWIGLVNLKFNDFLSKGSSHDYRLAPSDVKSMMWITVALVLGGPLLVDAVYRRQRRTEPDAGSDQA